jgi:hypothetical protein
VTERDKQDALAAYRLTQAAETLEEAIFLPIAPLNFDSREITGKMLN